MFSIATELYLGGVKNAYHMSPRQIVWFHLNQFKLRQARLHDASIAARSADFEAKDFEEYIGKLI
ncbi:hypothetical protein [Sulfitobacter sp. M22]|uniref:hypothetical protein n=1 Tax=Sulfitobacter sp. M22 TaxID=2675332 RepID=UPI001F370CEB|nr:hypothetical protein [Sulfitobacter sp. M22]MCF7728700.1 hypothetical protein [Sulfitobacter sp. M22]